MTSSREMKEYLNHHHISHMMETLVRALLHHRPEDPLSFLQSCLITAQLMGRAQSLSWDCFPKLGPVRPPEPLRPLKPPTPPSLPLKPLKPPPSEQLKPLKPPQSEQQKQLKPTSELLKPPILPSEPLKPLKPPQLEPQRPLKPTLEPLKPPTPPSEPLKLVNPAPEPLKTLKPPSEPLKPLKSPTEPLKPLKPQSGPLKPEKPPKPEPLKPKSPSATSCSIYFFEKISPAEPTHQHSTTSQILPGPPSHLGSGPPSHPGSAPPSHPGSAPPSHPGSGSPSHPGSGPPGSPDPPTPGHPDSGLPDHSAPGSGPPDSPNHPGSSSPQLHSKLSIDSDSELTESYGLQQEVGIHRTRRPFIIFIIGSPGRGTGLQMEKLAQMFGFHSISVDNHGETKDDLVAELRRQLIDQQDVFGFVLNGFPLDVHQALSFQEQIGCPDLVILLCSNHRASIHRHMDMVSLRRYYQQLSLLTEVDADQDEDAVFVVLSSLIKQKVVHFYWRYRLDTAPHSLLSGPNPVFPERFH